MSLQYHEIGDALIFISGIILLILSVVYFTLYMRYKKRNHFLASLLFIASASQLVVRKFDVLFPENWESDLPNLLAGIFSILIVLLILLIILFPETIPTESDIQALSREDEN